jgi:drug/metabolite transporter (DMT)-like permease
MQSSSMSRGQAVLCVAAGAALIGFAPIGVRLSEVGPQATAFWRFVFALPLLFLVVGLAPKERQPGALTAREWRLLVPAGVFFGMELGLWHWALGLTTVLNATLLSNMTPIIAALAGFVLFKERLSRAFMIGAGVAVGGAILLSVARAQGGTGKLEGDLLGLASALGYAAYLILMGRARKSVDVWLAMLITSFVAMIYAGVLSFSIGEVLLPQTAFGWAVLIGLGLVVQVGGQGLIAAGLGHLPIALSTVLLWVQPVAAAAFSWVLFGEALGPLALVGAGLVLGGIWLVQRAQ